MRDIKMRHKKCKAEKCETSQYGKRTNTSVGPGSQPPKVIWHTTFLAFLFPTVFRPAFSCRAFSVSPQQQLQWRASGGTLRVSSAPRDCLSVCLDPLSVAVCILTSNLWPHATQSELNCRFLRHSHSIFFSKCAPTAITWRHWSRDRWTHRAGFLIGGPLWPCVYLGLCAVCILTSSPPRRRFGTECFNSALLPVHRGVYARGSSPLATAAVEKLLGGASCGWGKSGLT